MLVAEAGTGIGKTLGYLAPAKQWIDQSAGSICISTYTKALQRQLSRETEKLYPDAATHREKVVVRKGRENYLCLLNLEDALQGGLDRQSVIGIERAAALGEAEHCTPSVMGVASAPNPAPALETPQDAGQGARVQVQERR